MVSSRLTSKEIEELYRGLSVEMTEVDCGKKCAPHNQGGKPFCCDIAHAVPTLYIEEWEYLQPRTDLWFRWRWEHDKTDLDQAKEEYKNLKAETPEGMLLMECLGPDHCQRKYRSITCRQFPFFPYLNSNDELLGLSYYEEYEEICWIASNLDQVNPDYVFSVVSTFDKIFKRIPEELINYSHHSNRMRESYQAKRRAIPLLHRNGFSYKVSPGNERLRRVPLDEFSKFGVYRITAELKFPDEE